MNSSLSKVIRRATAACGLVLAGALASSTAPASAATGAAAGHGVRPMDYSNIYNTASRRCLGTSGGHDDANAVLWNCNGHRDQSWTAGQVSPDNNDYYQLINQDGMCLGVAAGSTHNGARIVGWHCQGPGAKNQYWFYDCRWLGVDGNGCVLVNLGTPSNAYGDGGKVAGVSGGSTSNGAAIVLWTNTVGPNFAPNQAWDTNA